MHFLLHNYLIWCVLCICELEYMCIFVPACLCRGTVWISLIVCLCGHLKIFHLIEPVRYVFSYMHFMYDIDILKSLCVHMCVCISGLPDSTACCCSLWKCQDSQTPAGPQVWTKFSCIGELIEFHCHFTTFFYWSLIAQRRKE